MSELTDSSSKELNPDLPVRQHLVNTAVNFLANPDVQTRSNNSKIAFLKKKGLTDAEISLSLQISSKDDGNMFPNNPNNYMGPAGSELQQYSVWSRMRSIGSTFIILGVALYGLHQFYKLYIEHWLFGTEKKLSNVEQQLLEMNSSMTQLKTSVSVLEETIHEQKQQISNVLLLENYDLKPTPILLSELRNDIGCVKSLLMNRNQFPAVPKTAGSPTIPIWQLPPSEDKESKDGKEDVMDLTLTEKTETTIKDPNEGADECSGNIKSKAEKEEIIDLALTPKPKTIPDTEAKDPKDSADECNGNINGKAHSESSEDEKE